MNRPALRGFSLIELLAVLVVTAVVAAAAVPSLGTLDASRRRVCAARLVRDLGFARDAAAADALTTWAVFDSAAQTCTLRQEARTVAGGAGFATATPLTDPSTGDGTVLRFDSGEFAGVRVVSLSLAGGSRLGFDWRGRPLAHTGAPLSAPGTVALTGGLGVQVEPGTGAIRITP